MDNKFLDDTLDETVEALHPLSIGEYIAKTATKILYDSIQTASKEELISAKSYATTQYRKNGYDSLNKTALIVAGSILHPVIGAVLLVGDSIRKNSLINSVHATIFYKKAAKNIEYYISEK